MKYKKAAGKASLDPLVGPSLRKGNERISILALLGQDVYGWRVRLAHSPQCWTLLHVYRERDRLLWTYTSANDARWATARNTYTAGLPIPMWANTTGEAALPARKDA
jgi:hypothetical protein